MKRKQFYMHENDEYMQIFKSGALFEHLKHFNKRKKICQTKKKQEKEIKASRTIKNVMKNIKLLIFVRFLTS